MTTTKEIRFAPINYQTVMPLLIDRVRDGDRDKKARDDLMLVAYLADLYCQDASPALNRIYQYLSGVVDDDGEAAKIKAQIEQIAEKVNAFNEMSGSPHREAEED